MRRRQSRGPESEYLSLLSEQAPGTDDARLQTTGLPLPHMDMIHIIPRRILDFFEYHTADTVSGPE